MPKNSHSDSYKQRALYQIDKICNDLPANGELNTAARRIYHRYHDAGEAYGHSPQRIACGCIMLAAETKNIPISYNDLPLPAKETISAKRTLKDVCDVHTLPVSASAFLDRYAETLEIPDAMKERAQEILDNTISDAAPKTQAACAIIAASRETHDKINIKTFDINTNVATASIDNNLGEYTSQIQT